MRLIGQKSRLLWCAMVAGCLLLLLEGSTAASKQREAGSTENQVYTPAGLAVLPKITVGIAIGRAAELADGAENTSIIGGGLGIEFSAGRHSRLGLNTELVYGQSHQVKFDGKNGRVRSLSFAGSWLFRFSAYSRRSFYARTSAGLSHLTDENPAEYGTLTPAFLRLGLGHSHRGGSHSETRFELYYKRLFTSGFETKPEYRSAKFLFDVEYIGIELIMGFSIL